MKNMFVKGIVLGYLFLLMASCNTNEEKSTSVLMVIMQMTPLVFIKTWLL
jgi:hypothetical protein